MNNYPGDSVDLSFNSDAFVVFQDGRTFPCTNPEPNECRWCCPNDLGIGTFQRIKIRPGFELWMSNSSFHRDVIFNSSKIPLAIQFNFTLSGHYHVKFNDKDTPKQYCGEYQAIGYYHVDAESTCRVIPNVPIRYISITCDPEAFTACFEEYMDQMPKLIHDILANKLQCGYVYQSQITPAIREVMQQIIGCPYHGLTRRLFLEGKAFELLSLQLHQLNDNQFCSTSGMRMHPREKKQIEGVRDYLVSKMDTPPSLKELAKSAGMSHPKLNRCFKQVYGMTVFQYLRTERLNKARSMLQNEGYSVTETAYQVGYDSVSHFSQTYKKQFGASPSSTQKEENLYTELYARI